MAEFLIALFTMAGGWRVFQKMGRQGWEVLVPFYNSYVVFQELYGNGWRFLLYLIPLYNIYLYFKVNIDLARAFNQGTGFGVGLSLLPVVFVPLLGFGGSVYGDGTQAVHGKDAISRTLEDFSDKMTGEEKTGSYGREDAMKKLRELDELHRAGILTDAEFEAKKADILSRI